MSVPSATRTWWTRSSTPADTCVCATHAASSSRKCPTPAVQSAEGKSKTSSKPIGAHKGERGPTSSQQDPRVWAEKKCHISGNVNIGTFLKCFRTINVNYIASVSFFQSGTASFRRSFPSLGRRCGDLAASAVLKRKGLLLEMFFLSDSFPPRIRERQ